MQFILYSLNLSTVFIYILVEFHSADSTKSREAYAINSCK
jgi:hypothetical protein